jgi:hypothetical protein
VITLFLGEIGAWTQHVARFLARRAVKLLPAPAQDRYDEEWQAELREVRSGLAQIIYAIRLLIVALRLRAALKEKPLPSPDEVAFDEQRRFGRSRSVTRAVAGSLALLLIVLLSITTANLTGVTSEVLFFAAGVAAALTGLFTFAYEVLEKREERHGGPPKSRAGPIDR